ncbi:hypothetical protein PFISCL1PPCAC_14408 [Pristionchus fissidentatus]|uniref:Uncharacterized protein n=1 Tax=Pristionchus fissidentatus TaxID=1538716 RepID=A0AAV5VUE6_9BILA|nr:hypothetical protein PFISCL1PPCAC_14408 [Pristionchus fissidentatus]
MANLKEIIVRYESEEEEFARELEEMRAKLSEQSGRPSEDEADESTGESDVPQDPQPILTVLCDLVDEIGTLRNENRRLKTRLSLPRPRSRQTVVERMSALLDASGALFPRLKRQTTAASNATNAARISIGGARERLSTPPPKDALTASSISTDFSSLDSGRSAQQRRQLQPRLVPLVQPEISDSDFDEIGYGESEEGGVSSASDTERRARRDKTIRNTQENTTSRRRADQSLSDCTSPSSASSSRDVSEAMTTSRSSFLEILGMKKRRERPSALALLGVGRGTDKKRRTQRRNSDELNEGEMLLDGNGELIGRKRETTGNKRVSCRFTLNDDLLTGVSSKHNSVEYNSGSSAAPSPMPPHTKSDTALMNHVLSRHEHEKDNLRAEIEEMRTRNSRLLDQLREKSMLMAHVQTHAKSLEKQVEQLHRRCTLSEALDKLSLDDRLNARPARVLEKVEERLRLFEGEMQKAKADANSAHQMVKVCSYFRLIDRLAQTLSACTHERSCYRNCLEQIERLQKENFCLIRSRLIDSDDSAVRHRLAMMPSYDALYSFAMRVVRKLGVVRQTLLERCTELSRTEVDLISAQSTLLVTHAQIERLRLQQGKKRKRRSSSWHGADGVDRRVHAHLNFFLPFRLQSTRVANGRSAAKILPMEVVADGIENEFISLFGHARSNYHIEFTLSRISPPSTTRHRRRPQDEGGHHRRSDLPPASPPRSPQLGHYQQPPQNRIQRRASGSSRSTRWPTPQKVLAAARVAAVEQQHLYGIMGHRREEETRSSMAMNSERRRQRPVSLVECEGRLLSGGAMARNDARRRSQRGDHNRVGSGDSQEAKSARKDEKTVGFSDVRAVASMQDVSNPRTPNTTPQLTRRLAPSQHQNSTSRYSLNWVNISDDYAVPPCRESEMKRASSRLERARPVQQRTRPTSIMRNPDRRAGMGAAAAGGALLSGSWEESKTSSNSSPMTASRSPPMSPKASRLPLRSGGPQPPPPPQTETPKGLSWLSKLKHYKNSAK